MLQSKPQINSKTHPNGRPNDNQGESSQSRKIVLMGKISASIANEIYKPIDAVNRFINLALQGMEEDSQSREFLVESKKGVRRASVLLKRLNNYVDKIEKEVRVLKAVNE